MFPSHIVTTQDNYNNEEERRVADSINNLYNTDAGAFPSVFSFRTKLWLVLLVLSAIFIVLLTYLSFKQERVTPFFLLTIITIMVTLIGSAIQFTKGLLKDKREEDNRSILLAIVQDNRRILEEIQRIRRIDEGRPIEEENMRTQSSH